MFSLEIKKIIFDYPQYHLLSGALSFISHHIMPITIYILYTGLDRTEQILQTMIWPWCYKTFFMLNSAEHENLNALKY